ncbi:MAG: gliding motility lipoprotein GldD [Dysgonamonadaceae bacterium]|jgi:gliding motility-associated lipoprotein GldD|nr:gliding motility lipoprotein GldD [Dysgonamonadaceae bacterium]
MIKGTIFFVLSVLLGACSTDYSPKPAGYFYIDIPEHDYQTWSACPQFEFAVSSQAKVVEIPLPVVRESTRKKTNIPGEKWFNIVYPSLNAQIYCSYIPLAKNGAILEESSQLAFLHARKADAIQKKIFENPNQNVYGIVYELKGNVASPIQFTLTDSIKSFFRGALYFGNIPNQDSIAPVLEYINEDIHVLIDSFRWKK